MAAYGPSFCLLTMSFIHHTLSSPGRQRQPSSTNTIKNLSLLKNVLRMCTDFQLRDPKDDATGRVNPWPRLGESLCRVQQIPYLAQEVLQAVSHDTFANPPICRAHSTGPCPGGFPPGLRDQLLGHHCSAHCHMPGNTSLNIRRPACCLQVCPRLTLPTNQGSPSEDTSPIWVGRKIRGHPA